MNQLTSSYQDKLSILNSRRLSGRISFSVTSILLGFEEHDIPILVSYKLLTPLGKPAPNSPKYFASAEITSLSQNTVWLSKATSAVSEHWRKRNISKKEK